MATDLTMSEVLSVLTGLSLHYPGAKHTPDTLEEVARDMLADMDKASVSAKDFREAVAEARRSSEFFPNVAQILAAHQRLCETSRPRVEQLALPERHPADRNPALSLILRRSKEIRADAERAKRPLSFSEAYERARREVEKGATA